ncbi:MAG TPA: 3-hydroxyacyl-CoA dehydrogenase NAD-binding domain-containing protein [Lacunisphaera sp.]
MSTAPSLNPWFPPPPPGTPAPKPLRAIGIIGVGKIGTGIAHWCATKGMGVILHDPEAGTLSHGVEEVRGLFKAAEARNEITPAAAHKAMGGISITTGLEDLEFCDIIIETLTEDTAAKRPRFAGLARVMPPDALLASCVSAAELAEISAVTPGPERVIGLSFFDPVHESTQVQVTLGPGTSRQTAERVVAFVDALGKQVLLQGPNRSGA